MRRTRLVGDPKATQDWCSVCVYFAVVRGRAAAKKIILGSRSMKSLSALCLTTALVAALPFISTDLRADERSPAALTGQVSSDAEGAMEGVVVTARKDGSIVSTSVTTDAKGRYAFPENRLEPGHYTIAIRAVGYDLPAPTSANVA